MHRLFIALALAVLSLCTTGRAQYQPIAEEEKGKPFSVSAYVREEFDDNIFTADKGREEESWKTLVSPTFVLNYPMEQTLVSARYTFGLTWFSDRPGDDIDMSHDLVGRVAHTFSSRFDIDIRNRFRYDYEPDVLEGGFRKVNGDYITNDFSAMARFQWVPRFGNTLEYINQVVDYKENSISTTEDRMAHTVNFENRWSVLPTTTAVLGYRVNIIDYNDISKSSVGQFLFGGVDHKLLENWTTSIRAGVESRDFEEGSDEIAPYVSLNTTYNYAPGSTISFDYTHSMQVTDISVFTTQFSDAFRLSLFHAITPKLGARVAAGYTIGRFDWDNTLDSALEVDKDYNEYSLYAEGALTYSFARYLSGELGYIRTELDSDFQGRDYERNRYYIGVRGTY